MIWDLLVNALRASPIISALFLLAAANTKRPKRVQQTWLPVIAMVYGVVALVLLYRFNDNVATLADRASEILPFIPNWAGPTWFYIVENVVVVLAFLLIKFVTKPIFSRLFAKNHAFSQFAAAQIYEYDEDYELWFVERRFRRTRDFYRVLYWTSIAITVLLVSLALTFSDWPGFSTIAFPALATLIIGELYWAIDGLTRQEYDSSLHGEADTSRRVGNFGPLRKVLRDTFPDRVIGEGMHLSSLAALESGYRIGEMTQSPDPNVRLAGSYFDRLRNDGMDVDVNLAGAATELMRGSHVLFADPFYHDLAPYLSLPAYRELLEGRKCLIVAGRSALAPELADWISSGLEAITGIPGLWRIATLDGASKDDLDVGVLRFADLHNRQVLGNNDDFLREVGLIILAEPSLILPAGQLGLELVLRRCARQHAVTVAAFDGNHDGLVDTLSHVVKHTLTEVVASSLPQGASSEVIWTADGPHMHTAILPGLSRYLGIGTEISAVALKYQVSQVHWVGGEVFPVKDMNWIAQQYYPSINRFADLELSQDALDSALVAVGNPWGLPQKDNYFLVVEDEINNVYETVRRYATRATRSGFINLISDDYLLRDYMVDNRGIFIADPKAVPSIVSDYTRTERNVMLRILLEMRLFGVSERELKSELALLGWEGEEEGASEDGSNDSPGHLRALHGFLRDYLGLTGVEFTMTEPGIDLYDDEQDGFRYSLVEGPADDQLADLAPAYFLVEDDRAEINVVGSLLLDHVHQRMLPGQFVTFGGVYYEVRSVSNDMQEGRVILRRAADHINQRRAYRQIRSYELSNLRPATDMAATRYTGGILLTRLIGDISAESLGYLEMTSRNQIADAKVIRVSGVPRRNYTHKTLLRIQLPGASDAVRRTLTVILNELFVTVFPHSHDYVRALTVDEMAAQATLLDSLSLIDSQEPSNDDIAHAIFIVEDSTIDMGLISAVERNWDRLIDIVTDYLAWNDTQVPLDSDFVDTLEEILEETDDEDDSAAGLLMFDDHGVEGHDLEDDDDVELDLEDVIEGEDGSEEGGADLSPPEEAPEFPEEGSGDEK